MTSIKYFWDNYKFIVSLTVVSFLVFFLFERLNPDFFLYDDNSTQFLPFYKYNWVSLVENHTIPLINFHQYLGQTYLAQGQSGVLYPPVYIAAFLSKLLGGDFFITLDILALIHIIAASISMYCLLRFNELDHKISFVFSLIWVSIPYFIVLSKGWIIMSYFLLYIPLCFLFLLRLLKYCRMRDVLLLSLVNAFFFFQGYIQNVFIYFVFEFLFIILYFRFGLLELYKTKTSFFRQLTLYFYSKLIFLLLILPLLLPVLINQKVSAHRSEQLSFLTFMRFYVPLRDFLSSQLFLFKKNVIFGVDSEIYFSGLFFITIFLVFIFIKKKIDLRIEHRKNTIIFFLLALSALVFSTLFNSVFYIFPLFNSFRWPFKYLAMFFFFQCLFTAILLNAVYLKYKKFRYLILLLCILVFVVNIIMISYKPQNVTARKPFYRNAGEISPYLGKENGRIFTLGKINNKKRSLYRGELFATFYDEFHFAGYDPLVSKENHTKALGLGQTSNYKGILSPGLLKYLSGWSVKYFIVGKEDKNNESKIIKRLKLVYFENDILIYENPYSYPLVYYLNRDLRITKAYFNNPPKFNFGVNKITVDVGGSPGEYMVLNIIPLKNYQTFVDGKKINIKVNKIKDRLTLKIPKDSDQIVISYFEPYFYYGFIISLFTLFVIITLFIFKRV